ncbi:MULTISPECIES: hypothetical protein [unclassified Nocardioides]|uniref:hypothetical protein n=1 Tax=unclassified Nocardioides TaxID=2615069 RepID=UPI003621CCE0
MSVDFNALLREVADRSERVSLADPETVRRTGDGRVRRRQLRVVIGLVLVIALGVAVGRSLLGSQGGPRPVEPIPTPTATGSPTAEANGGPAVHPIETGPHRFSAHAIAVRNGRFVVVGDSSQLEEGGGPPVYWSDDAVQWQEPARDGAPDSHNLTDVISTDSGFLAVGVDAGGPAAWRSVDGQTWVRSPVDAPARGGTDALWGITSTRLGYFAWGFDGGHAGLWRSSDGTSWARAGDQRVFDLPRSETICAIREVDGGLTAPGVVAPRGSRDGRRVAWSSTDGSEWVLTRDDGESTIWCDPPAVLGHLEASNRDVGLVGIDPYGEGNDVSVTAPDS